MDNKYQQISLHIRNEIIALAVDGMKLPSIRELSTHFNVTTITIRKALKVLEEEKLIEVRGTSGTYLTEKARREKNFLNFGLLAYDIFLSETLISTGFAAGSILFLRNAAPDTSNCSPFPLRGNTAGRDCRGFAA
ncbi:MAG: winged helix-turn-helix domain-containing protein [Victivallales bacterium]